MKLELDLRETSFLLMLLQSDNQTALQLLAAEYYYQPTLLPKLKKLERALKAQQAKLVKHSE
jgi:hypothetical protein